MPIRKTLKSLTFDRVRRRILPSPSNTIGASWLHVKVGAELSVLSQPLLAHVPWQLCLYHRKI